MDAKDRVGVGLRQLLERPKLEILLTWGTAALGAVIPWSVGIGVKLHLVSEGKPTWDWSYFLQLQSLLVELWATLWFAAPSVGLAFFAHLLFSGRFPRLAGLASFEKTLIVLASALCGGVASGRVFLDVFWLLDPSVFLFPSAVVIRYAGYYLLGLVAGCALAGLSAGFRRAGRGRPSVPPTSAAAAALEPRTLSDLAFNVVRVAVAVDAAITVNAVLLIFGPLAPLSLLVGNPFVAACAARFALAVLVWRRRLWACLTLSAVYFLSQPLLLAYGGLIHDYVLASNAFIMLAQLSAPLAIGLLLFCWLEASEQKSALRIWTLRTVVAAGVILGIASGASLFGLTSLIPDATEALVIALMRLWSLAVPLAALGSAVVFYVRWRRRRHPAAP
jgi:hypothetical protein